jgi:hypothetical protein
MVLPVLLAATARNPAKCARIRLHGERCVAVRNRGYRALTMRKDEAEQTLEARN